MMHVDFKNGHVALSNLRAKGPISETSWLIHEIKEEELLPLFDCYTWGLVATFKFKRCPFPICCMCLSLKNRPHKLGCRSRCSPR